MADTAGPSKQFGLIMPKKTQLSAPKAINVFGDDSDLDEDDGVDWVQKSLKAEAEKNRIKKQARINAERALAEDPTIYQYDEIYSEIHVDDQKKKEEKKKKQQEPKYIKKLLQNAEKRKRENEIRIERMVQKEREAEGDMFKDKDKFVTASYRKKLEENKKLEEEEKERDRLEAIGDVTKQVNIDGFYRHIFNQTFEIGPKKEMAINKDVENKKEPDQEDKTKIVSSKEQNPDADDSSVNDSDSDSPESKKEALKIISKKRKGKQYRQRAAEASESEPEEEKSKEKEDSNFKEIEVQLKASKDKSTEEPSSSENKQNNGDKEEKNEAKDNEDRKNDSNKRLKENEEKPKPIKPVKNTSIWKKRTVGPVFEAALQRYYARQAMRISGS